MRKSIVTFILGAAAGGSTIAFVPREKLNTSAVFKGIPEAAKRYEKQSNSVINEENGNKSRFIERSSRKPSWENFEIRPSKEWDWNWDYRHYDKVEAEESTKAADNIDSDQNKTIKPTRPTATRHIILVRHGQYNLDGKTDEERYLTKLGCEQAQATGERLANLDLPLSYVVSSTMTRAKETANLIRPFLPSQVSSLPDDSILCEGAPFPPEPRSTWKPEYYYSVDGSRIEAAFRKYFHRAEKEQSEDSYEVVVCHANVIRYFVCRALQLPPEAWLRISLKHGSMTWITIRPDGRTSIRALGESGYMQPTKLTTTWTVSPY